MRRFAVALLLLLPAAGGAEQESAVRSPAEAATAKSAAAISSPQPAVPAKTPTTPASSSATPAIPAASDAKPAKQPEVPGKPPAGSDAVAAPAAAKEPSVKEAPAKAPRTPPAKGSQVKADDNFCFVCHTNKDQWDEKDPKSWRLYVPPETLKEDAHFHKGVNCHDCHGGNFDTDKVNVAHATEDGFRAKPEEVKKYCAVCHAAQASTLAQGAHRGAGEKDGRGVASPLACEKCHGQAPRPGLPPVVSHGLLPVKDKRSPISPESLAQTCSACHKDEKNGMLMGVHAKVGPKDERGAGTPLDCLGCHGPDMHGILPSRDPRSPVFLDNQVRMCDGCHKKKLEAYKNDLDTYSQSVHGQGLFRSGLLVTPACADCSANESIRTGIGGRRNWSSRLMS